MPGNAAYVVIPSSLQCRVPAKRGEPIEEVETDGDDLDRNKHKDPEGVLERLQEGDQLGLARLLKQGVRRSDSSFILKLDCVNDNVLLGLPISAAPT